MAKKSAAAKIESSKSAEEATKVLSQSALQERLTFARTKLLLRQPFFGYLVSNLEDILGADWLTTGTAGTDGKKIYWDSAFLSSLSDDDLMFVLAHEAMHCALAHLWRRGSRDALKWNLCCDAVVNDMLSDSGMKARGDAIRGSHGKSAEELYENIDQLLQANKIKIVEISARLTDCHDPWEKADLSDPETRQLADAWKAAVSNAKQFGKMPAGVARHIDELLNPRRDWRDLLREGLFFPEDYQWTPTDRRFPEILLPTLTGEIHRVVIAVDTSGSICGEQLGAFWTELLAILRNNRCEARVLSCDADIHDEWDHTSFDPSCIKKIRGGGGTSFVPVFEKVKEYIAAGWVPEAVVYLTDMMGQFPDQGPDVRTIWVTEKAYEDYNAPFGEKIVLE